MTDGRRDLHLYSAFAGALVTDKQRVAQRWVSFNASIIVVVNADDEGSWATLDL